MVTVADFRHVVHSPHHFVSFRRGGRRRAARGLAVRRRRAPPGPPGPAGSPRGPRARRASSSAVTMPSPSASARSNSVRHCAPNSSSVTWPSAFQSMIGEMSRWVSRRSLTARVSAAVELAVAVLVGDREVGLEDFVELVARDFAVGVGVEAAQLQFARFGLRGSRRRARRRRQANCRRRGPPRPPRS